MSAGATDKIALPNDRRLRPKSAKQPHVGKILLVCFFARTNAFLCLQQDGKTGSSARAARSQLQRLDLSWM